MKSIRFPSYGKAGILAVIGGGLLLRVLWLSADPAYYAWAGHISDEGRWTQQARELVLFGSLDLRYWLSVVHLAMAPLYQATTWVSFSLLGVSFLSARLVSAVCGCALVVALWRILRKHLSPSALVVSLTAVSLQPDLIVLSRIAVPEMAAMLFELLAFALIVLPVRSARRSALAGMMLAISLGFKGTGFPLVPIFAGVIAVSHDHGDPSTRLAKIAAFAGVIIACALSVLIGAAVVADPAQSGFIVDSWPALSRFTALADPYPAVTFLFYGDYTPSINFLLLVAWITGGIVFAAGPLPRGSVRTLYLASALWAAAWLFVAALLDYFPERYIFHAVVPLAIHIGAGLTLTATIESHALIDRLRAMERARRAMVALWFAVPVGVLLTPLAVEALNQLGLSLPRFTQRISLMIILILTVGGVSIRALHVNRLLTGLITFPGVLTILWFFSGHYGLTSEAFWPGSGDSSIVGWTALTIVALLLTTLVTSDRRLPTYGAMLLAVFLAGIGLARSAPDILRPTYTLLRAAEQVDGDFASREVIWTHRASSLFLGSTAKYREVDDGEAPDLIVSMYMLPVMDPQHQYDVVAEYEIRFGDDYHARHPDADPFLRIMRQRP